MHRRPGVLSGYVVLWFGDSAFPRPVMGRRAAVGSAQRSGWKENDVCAPMTMGAGSTDPAK